MFDDLVVVICWFYEVIGGFGVVVGFVYDWVVLEVFC